MIKFVDEDAEFGLMSWRLLSRNPEKSVAIYVLPMTGVGVYWRTVIKEQWEEPILLKNTLVIETVERVVSAGIVDADGQDQGEPTFKCLHRELMSLDVAKARFMPKGKSAYPGLEIFPGALLTQEQRPLIVPARAEVAPEVAKKIAEARP